MKYFKPDLISLNPSVDAEFMTSMDRVWHRELSIFMAKSLAREVSPQVAAFAEHLAAATPGARSVLFYGSVLRSGSLDGVLDFYVLCDGAPERGIWPRVSYREWAIGGTILRAKVATMNLATFRAAARGESIDTTIWTRFAQPSALIWHRDLEASAATTEAVIAAAVTSARLAIALGPVEATARKYWSCLFRATYESEFRLERPGREEEIVSSNLRYFVELLPLALKVAGIQYERESQSILPIFLEGQRAAILRWWRVRRRLGKALNIVRLLRASTTFEGAARYAAWKIERHTGVKISITPWHERYPLFAAPGVLWALWRRRRRSALQ